MCKSIAEHLKACASITLRAVGENNDVGPGKCLATLFRACNDIRCHERVEAYADIRELRYHLFLLLWKSVRRIVCRQKIAVRYILSHVTRALAEREGYVVRGRRL